MYDIAGILGWIVFGVYILAVLNFFLKSINKSYISKLRNNSGVVGIYRTIMKYIVKYHKIIGSIAILAAAFHFILMAVFIEISLSGAISGALLLCTGFLGIYGAYINKNIKGKWLKVHKILSFLLAVSIFVHVFL